MMTAVLYDDVITEAPERRPALATAAAPASKRARQAPVGGGDPMVNAAARLLSIPLRHMYAVLWRVGVIEVTA
jgi:hypothetical protein